MTSECKKETPKRSFAHSVAGALSGAVSRLVVGPLDVLKIRFQVQREPIACSKASHYKSIGQAFRTIIREEGVKVRE